MSWVKFYVKTHNYLGLGLSLFFFLLFGSGIVMMFVGYPIYQDLQRFPDLPSLDGTSLNFSVQRAFRESGLESHPLSIRLNTLQDRPVYRFEGSDGSYRMVFADNGELLKEVDSSRARRTVQWFMSINHIEGSVRAHGKMTDVDAWTTNPSFSGSPHWPFYKYELGDSEGTQLYVSSETAEVFHKTIFWQRFWGYLGPVIHYFYVPIDLRQFPNYWFGVVVFISGFGTILCALGLIIGVIFFRWEQLGRWLSRWLPGKTKQPTKSMLSFTGWLYWHNFLGMLFGVITFTWIFSGMMSMNPLNLHSPTPTETERFRWTGEDLSFGGLTTTFHNALDACRSEIDVKEIRLHQLAGNAYYYCLESPTSTRLVFDAEEADAHQYFSAEQLKLYAPELMPDWDITEFSWLQNYDSYYQLGRSERIGDQVKRLPVLRVKINDPSQSWFYIDPSSGSLISHFRTESRLNRWLFDGLHTLDFSWLHERRRALWWTVMLFFMIGGIGLSSTSVWLTLRWFWKKTIQNTANY